MPAGRPSKFTPELAESICESLIAGDDLVAVCSAKNMPARSTVYQWMDENPEFRTAIARAREGQADYMDHKIAVMIDKITPESAQADRVKLAALQWRAAKLKPRFYGDKVQNEHSGPDGKPMQVEEVLSDFELARRLAFALERGRLLAKG